MIRYCELFQTSCTYDYLTHTMNNYTYVAFMFLTGFIVPFFAIVGYYVCMLRFFYHHNTDMKNLSHKYLSETKSESERGRKAKQILKIHSKELKLAKVNITPVHINRKRNIHWSVHQEHWYIGRKIVKIKPQTCGRRYFRCEQTRHWPHPVLFPPIT